MKPGIGKSSLGFRTRRLRAAIKPPGIKRPKGTFITVTTMRVVPTLPVVKPKPNLLTRILRSIGGRLLRYGS